MSFVDILQDVGVYTGVTAGVYTSLLLGTQAIGNFTSEKIKSQEDLDRVVKEESERLGLENPRLTVATFHRKGTPSYEKVKGARCWINKSRDSHGREVEVKVLDLKEGYGARRSAVRHELYHLHRHFPLAKSRLGKFIRGLFYEEPTATLYEAFGIRL